MTVPEHDRRLAIAADGLTFVRGAIAVALIPVLGREHITVAAVLVGLAWLSDTADGRVARASGLTTALGPWDLEADTAVGAALVLGLTVSGWLGWWLGIGLVGVLAGAFLVTRNEAMSMSIQAIGYALLVWRTWSDGHTLAFRVDGCRGGGDRGRQPACALGALRPELPRGDLGRVRDARVGIDSGRGAVAQLVRAADS